MNALHNPLVQRSIRHLPIGFFLLAILAYGGGFGWYLVARFDFLNLLNWQYDDAFYYFQIAKNLAAGKFSTFDDGITRTNGYHPLWLLLITPLYWFFDPKTALFAIKALEIMLIAGGVALLALAARLSRLPWILLIAVLPLLYQQDGMLRGLEASAALATLGGFFLALSLFARNPARWAWLLAAVGFALPWARLEFAVIALTAAAAVGLLDWSRRGSAFGVFLAAFIRSRNALPLLGAAAGLILYFVYNKLVFDGMVPVSGAAKTWWAQFFLNQEHGYDLARRILWVLRRPYFRYELLVAAEVFAYLALVWWSARRSQKRDDWLLLVFLVGVCGLAAEQIAKALWMFATNPRGFFMGSWYHVPAYLMMALIVPVRCFVAVYFVRRLFTRRAANFLALGIVVVGVGLLLPRANFLQPFRAVDEGSTRISYPRLAKHYATAQLMNWMLPEGSIIGAWDCGIVGYFSRFPVVNLEGLVNGYDYLRALQALVRRENLQWRDFSRQWLPGIHQDFRLTHFANQPSPAEEPHVLFESWPSNQPEALGGPVMVSSVTPPDSFDVAAWFWERLAPHFHYQRANIGVSVDDRLARVFIKDCEPDRLRNAKVAFTWKANGTRGGAQYTWLRPGKNRLEVCFATFVLPQNTVDIEMALLPDQVRRPD